MKIVKGILIAIAIIFMLAISAAAPVALIGLFIFIIGLFLRGQNRRGRISFSKSGWLVAAGLVSSLVLGTVFMDSADVEQDTNKTKVESVAKEKEKEAAEKKAEAEKKKLAEEKAKAEAEEKKLAEEKAAQEKEEALKKEQEQENLTKSLGLELVTVGRVVDGDTFETTDGRKIRLVGVNTPESTTRIEEYGKEASNYATSKLSGKQVWIQKDVSETDRYSRLLRIVWLSIPTNDMDENEIRSKMFNADLVINGYAEPSTYPPDVKYSEYFLKFAREARAAQTGLWAFGDQGTTKGDLDTAPKASNNNSGSTSSGSTTSGGNAPSSSSGSEKEFFQNCTEMRKVYPNGVPSTHPAYDSKHDRDKDNFACER